MIRIRWSARDWIEKLDGYEIGQGSAVYLNSQKIGMGSKLRAQFSRLNVSVANVQSVSADVSASSIPLLCKFMAVKEDFIGDYLSCRCHRITYSKKFFDRF